MSEYEIAPRDPNLSQKSLSELIEAYKTPVDYIQKTLRTLDPDSWTMLEDGFPSNVDNLMGEIRSIYEELWELHHATKAMEELYETALFKGD